MTSLTRQLGSGLAATGFLVAFMGACAETGTLASGTGPGGPTLPGSGGSGGVGGVVNSGGTSGADAGSSGGAGGTTGGGGGSAATGGTGGGEGATGGQGGADPCDGVSCNTPPANSCADANDLLVYGAQGTCSDGDCSYGSSTTPCANGCVGSACTGDPCVGVSCNGPPANSCADANNLTVFETPGTCDGSSGTCSYGSHQQFCQHGCQGSGCVGDPCAGVNCAAPPASYCSAADQLTVYEVPGSCNAASGDCSYGSHAEFCAFGCVAGACDGDPCAGVSCGTPPANYCTGVNTARIYQPGGSCANGTCSYPSQDTPCSLGCLNGSCKECDTNVDCGSGRQCVGNVCQDCTSDNACGSTCADCSASAQVCENGSCVEPGCPPPTAACSNGSQDRKGCGGARVIGRPQAAAGFMVSDDTCDASWNFNESGGCWDANADHSYRLYMRQGEVAVVQINEKNGGCQGSWSSTLSIYTNSGCADTSCNQRIQCDEDGDRLINYTAAYDGWHIFVVDGRHSSDDEGEYDFSVALTCSTTSCGC